MTSRFRHTFVSGSLTIALLVILVIVSSGVSTFARATYSRTGSSAPLVSTSIVISEFRTHGPGGSADEFVELYNLSSSSVAIGGLKVNGSNNSGSVSTRVVISTGVTLPAYAHYLVANTGYSGSVTPDQTYGTGITDDGGIAILDASNAVIDGVGMSTGSAYGEGTRLAPLGSNTDQSYERKPGGTGGSWQDTDNNSADFIVTAPSAPQNSASAPVPPSGTPVATGTNTPAGSPAATGTNTNTPAATFSPTATPTPSSLIRVLFDNAHAETAGNADWIISTSIPDPLLENPNPTVESSWTGGASAWGVALQRTGRYSLKTTNSAITYGNSGNTLDLSRFDVLVLPEPNTLFTTAEKTAILNFVREGGGLFMVADHDGSDRNNDGNDSLRIFNDLMNNGGIGNDPFGIQFDVLNIASENPANDTPYAEPILQGPFGNAVSTIIRNGTTETLNRTNNPNARGVIYRSGFSNTGNTGAFVSRSMYGNGRIVALGDSSAFDDGTCQPGNTCYNGWNDPAGNNAILFPNATEWLGGGPPTLTSTPTNTPVPTQTNTRTNTPTFTRTSTPTSTFTPTPTLGTPVSTPSVKIYMLYASAYGTPQTDEAIRIENLGSSSANLGGWQINNSSGAITLPLTTTLAPGAKLWIANTATGFDTYFGFNPDFEYAANSDPSVPDATATAGYSFPDAGGAVQLRDSLGAVQDTLVYGTGNTGTLGWSGSAVQYFTNSSFTSVGQILYRKLNEATGLPVPDTDTSDDWAQDSNNNLYNDNIDGKKILRPGWGLTDPANEDLFFTKSFSETGVTTKFLVAPDNIYDPVRSLILSATTSITIETYEWKAAPLVTDIINAKNRGVNVSIALDGNPVGGIDNDTLWAADQWTNAGIPVYFFDGTPGTPSDQYRYVNVHAKFMIVDNTWLATGSENFSLTSMPSDPKGDGTKGHRGTFVITNAPNVVAYARRLNRFDVTPGKYPDLLLYPNAALPTPPAGYSPTPMPNYTSYMPVKPTPLVVTEDEPIEIVQSPDNSLRDNGGLIGLVNSAGAGDTVMVTQQYERTYWQTNVNTGPNPRLQAYIAAAQRGANVRILLDAQFDGCGATDNSATVNYVSSFGLPNLQAKIGTPTADSIHDKMVLVQHNGIGTVHTSSINGSENSSKANREFGLQITSNAAYQYYKDVFDYDWAHSFVSNCFVTPTATPTAPGGFTATSTATSTITVTASATNTPTSTPTVGSPTATFTPIPGANHVVISEFRTRGPAGGNDEFIELYNPTLLTVDVSGWKISASNGSGTVGVRLTISNSIFIPPHAHFLAVNTATGGYSGTVTGDATYSSGITDDGGIAVLDAGNAIVDQVGLSSGSTYGEGTRLPAFSSSNIDHSYERLPGGNMGSTQDTGDNAGDFVLIAPSAPQNLSSTAVPPVGSPTVTSTVTVTPTATVVPTFTATATNTPTNSPTFTVTQTSVPTFTATFTATSTQTSVPTSTMTPTPTGTSQATPTASGTVQAVLVGHVTWQGRPAQPNTLNQLPVTLTLRSALDEVNYAVQNTDAGGFFTVSVGSLPSGTYNWRTKGPKFLAISGTVSLTGAGTTQLEMGVLKTGDSNNDNRVNATDFTILKLTFGKAVGDPGFDDRGDLNGDTRVNVTDFNLQKSNFGFAGAPPIAPVGGPIGYDFCTVEMEVPIVKGANISIRC